jgi:acylphosphatase
MIALRVRVTGRVQGVWFRGWTKAEAEARGLHGWVRNEADGSVAALIAGPEAAVREMVAALHEGPPLAGRCGGDGARGGAGPGPGFHVVKA